MVQYPLWLLCDNLPSLDQVDNRVWYERDFYNDMTEFYKSPTKSKHPTIRNIEVKNSAHEFRLARNITGELNEYDVTHVAMAMG